MIGIGSNKLIIELYNDIKNGNLKLQPSFQRKLVWNEKHKESFIETILLGLPFPEIYTAIGDINLETRKSEILVVDGQQRLSTIYEYITGAENFTYNTIKMFKELSDEEQKEFFKYVVVVRDLGHISIDKIKQIFKRINSVDYALEAIEIDNALYDGEYISTAKQILNSINLYSALKDSEISRMKDLEFVLSVMITNDLKGYFTGYKEVENFVKSYNSFYPYKEQTIKDFNTVIELIDNLGLSEDSIWINSKSCYFTLLVELLRIITTYDLDYNKDKILTMLNSLEESILNNKDFRKNEINEYALFYKAMYQGTSSKKNRTTRGELLRKKLIGSLK